VKGDVEVPYDPQANSCTGHPDSDNQPRVRARGRGWIPQRRWGVPRRRWGVPWRRLPWRQQLPWRQLPRWRVPWRRLPRGEFRGGRERFDRFDRFHGFDRFDRFDRFHRFERFDRFDRFDRFHRFAFFGDFGFVGPFFWDPFWFPAPYAAYTYAPPLVIQPEPPSSPTGPAYWYYCADAKAYYPYTQACPGGWLKVVPTPAG
jgi:hypothetical protein